MMFKPRKILSAIAVCALIPLAASAAGAPRYTGVKSFREAKASYYYDIGLTDDGGYIVAADSVPTGAADDYDDAMLVKYDNAGNVQWQKTYALDNHDAFMGVAQVDGGYIATGMAQAGDGWESEQQARIAMLDDEGEVLWDELYAEGDESAMFCDAAAIDGGYVAVGFLSENYFDQKALLARYSSDGTLQKTYTPYYGMFYRILKVDGGYIAAGEYYSTDEGADDDSGALLVKYNTNLDVAWQKKFPEYEHFSDVAADGGSFVAVGCTKEKDDSTGYKASDAAIAKVGPTGNKLWGKTFGGTEFDIFDGVAVVEGSYAAVGYSFSIDKDLAATPANDYDALMVMFDASGNNTWQAVYGGDNIERFTAAVFDGSKIVAAGAENYSFGDDFETINPYNAMIASYNVDGGDGFGIPEPEPQPTPTPEPEPTLPPVAEPEPTTPAPIPEPVPLQDGWQQRGDGWYYYRFGQPVKGWLRDGVTAYGAPRWYFLNETNGVMMSGWVKHDDNSTGVSAWYYMNRGGVMLTGWNRINSEWYYFKGSGAMSIGWQKVGHSWYYMAASGKMLTGWQKVGSGWYYMNASGKMLTGWQQIGDAATGASQWYWFDASGRMATGKQTIGGKAYNFSGSGALLQ